LLCSHFSVFFDGMDKQLFLREQYLDVLASGAHVCERWRSAFENFYDDLINATPTHASRRFLMYRDPEIGFEPGNVEWHFRRSPGRAPPKVSAPQKTKITEKVNAKAKKASAASKAKREETRRREAERQKEQRRKMIADQYRQWEEKRLRAPR
jgi:hypothetical protein